MGRWWVSGVAVALVAASTALATSIKRLSLTEVVHQADEIFVGTVRDQRTLSGDRERELILTEVTFEDLDVFKGDVRTATLRYRFAGGTLGARTLSVAGMPRFENGKRYVLFTNAEEDWICPAVGWWQGRYTVEYEDGTGQEILCDSDGRPVYRFASGAPLTNPARKGDRPMRLRTFLKRVSHLVDRAKPNVVPEPPAETGAETELQPPGAQERKPAPDGETDLREGGR